MKRTNQTLQLFRERLGGTTSVVVLPPRLKVALHKLNSGVARDAIQLSKDRGA